jgi:DNA-binding response OmpR family regulator
MSTDSATVLLVSADADRSAFLSDQFTADGFEVVTADHAAVGIRSLGRVFPDLVVVDTDLPDRPGFDVVAAVRDADRTSSRVDPSTPIVALAGRPDVLERVRALERGVDDVLTLPLHYPELLARTRAVMRRSQGRRREGLVRVGALAVDPISRTVTLDGTGIELSQKEWALLQILASEPTRVFSKEELLRNVWGFRANGRTRTLDSHACRLRQKLCVGGSRFVINVWGVGYRLIDGPIEVSPHGVGNEGLRVATPPTAQGSFLAAA